MNINTLLAEVLAGNLGFLQGTLSDFSDADMLVRPVPGANHAAWQLGHLIVAESNMVNAAKTGAGAELAAGFAEKFKKTTAGNDDPSFFPKKGELLAQFDKVRQATIAFAKNVTQAELNKPMPEPISGFAPTVEHLLTLMPVHVAMHVGQFQVLRRKLGKPILF
jgi:hypothetical protein